MDAKKKLVGYVFDIASLPANRIEEIYSLRNRFFSPISRINFDADLAKKHWVILLVDVLTGRARGFSTIRKVDVDFERESSIVFISGETIIDPDFWGQLELPRIWGRYVLQMAMRQKDAKAYWLLITSSYRVYRFLPLFFREYYPRRDRPTPPKIKRLLDYLASREFGSEYDPGRGIVRFSEPAPLRRDLISISKRHLKDPEAVFFANANPHYAEGDELVCLAALNKQNLTAAALRILE
ncbi:MAG TPA: hypothetical protein GXX40_02920 [Firmicutes bacterium]|nr:hypothetical protein [Bacillota bacterium]